MFERYTEKARRVIFFARYEASQFGSPLIETEHVLLGILRETEWVKKMLPDGATDSIRSKVESHAELRERVSTSVDLPVSNAVKRVLAYGAEEAARLNHRHIGSEHLFLGLLHEKDGMATKLLQPFGVKLEEVRGKLARMADEQLEGARSVRPRGAFSELITIHGSSFHREAIRRAISRCREYNWHWQKAQWQPRDVLIHQRSHRVSFDLSLASDTENFEVAKGGWTKDHCAICRWELFASADDHGTGYTNGREWICVECYDRFWNREDFISGSYSEIT